MGEEKVDHVLLIFCGIACYHNVASYLFGRFLFDGGTRKIVR